MSFGDLLTAAIPKDGKKHRHLFHVAPRPDVAVNKPAVLNTRERSPAVLQADSLKGRSEMFISVDFKREIPDGVGGTSFHGHLISPSRERKKETKERR